MQSPLAADSGEQSGTDGKLKWQREQKRMTANVMADVLHDKLRHPITILHDFVRFLDCSLLMQWSEMCAKRLLMKNNKNNMQWFFFFVCVPAQGRAAASIAWWLPQPWSQQEHHCRHVQYFSFVSSICHFCLGCVPLILCFVFDSQIVWPRWFEIHQWRFETSIVGHSPCTALFFFLLTLLATQAVAYFTYLPLILYFVFFVSGYHDSHAVLSW